MSHRIIQRLEYIANVAIVIAAIACIGLWTAWYLRHRTLPPEFTVGETWPAEAGVPLAPTETSLVLFISSTCQYCTDSMSFYQELVKTRDDLKVPVHVVVASFDDAGTLKTYLSLHRLAVDRISAVARGQRIKIRSTPTILEIDAHGRIRRLWTGKLSPEGEREVLGSLTGAAL